MQKMTSLRILIAVLLFGAMAPQVACAQDTAKDSHGPGASQTGTTSTRPTPPVKHRKPT